MHIQQQLKLQIDETQLKRSKRKLLLFSASLLYNSITYPCHLSSPTSSAPPLPPDMTMCFCFTPLLYSSVFIPRLLLLLKPMRSCPKFTLDPNPTKCEPLSYRNRRRLHLRLR